MVGVLAQPELRSGAAIAADDLAAAADASLSALEQVAIGLADLVVDAAELDERARAVVRRELELRNAERELGERELVLGHAQLLVEERTRELQAKAARLHWRWLLRAWRWRPPPAGREFRACDFLFVPTADGYVLLEQEGVALRPGAILTGLIDSDVRFVVTKIAPWEFDGRWCAYLQQISQPNEERGIDGID
jgi:hypothetical protein